MGVKRKRLKQAKNYKTKKERLKQQSNYRNQATLASTPYMEVILITLIHRNKK